MMSEPKKLHSLSSGEWYTRAIKERGSTQQLSSGYGYADGEEVRIVFTLPDQRGDVSWIVDRFVSEVWPFYQITEHCRHRYGVIVTVEEGPDNAPQQGS